MPKMRATFSFDSFLKRYRVGTRSTFSRRIARANRSRGFSSLIPIPPPFDSTTRYCSHPASPPPLLHRHIGHHSETEHTPALAGGCGDVLRRRPAAEADQMGPRLHQAVEARGHELGILVRHRRHDLRIRLRRDEDLAGEAVFREVAAELPRHHHGVVNADGAVRADDVDRKFPGADEGALGEEILVPLHDVADGVTEEGAECCVTARRPVHEGEGDGDGYLDTLIRKHMAR